jgi:hypothetical protein
VFHTGTRVDDAASRGVLDKDLVDVLLWLVVQLDAAKICLVSLESCRWLHDRCCTPR